MGAAPLAAEAQHRPVFRAVAARRQRTGTLSHRDQDERKSHSKHRGQERGQADARVRNRDHHNGGNHPQPSHTLDRNVRHVDERG